MNPRKALWYLWCEPESPCVLFDPAATRKWLDNFIDNPSHADDVERFRGRGAELVYSKKGKTK